MLRPISAVLSLNLNSVCFSVLQDSMPELPADFRRRYSQLGLPPADVLVLADELPTAQYFEAVLAAGAPAKPAANWIMGDIMAFCKVCNHSLMLLGSIQLLHTL